MTLPPIEVDAPKLTGHYWHHLEKKNKQKNFDKLVFFRCNFKKITSLDRFDINGMMSNLRLVCLIFHKQMFTKTDCMPLGVFKTFSLYFDIATLRCVLCKIKEELMTFTTGITDKVEDLIIMINKARLREERLFYCVIQLSSLSKGRKLSMYALGKTFCFIRELCK